MPNRHPKNEAETRLASDLCTGAWNNVFDSGAADDNATIRVSLPTIPHAAVKGRFLLSVPGTWPLRGFHRFAFPPVGTATRRCLFAVPKKLFGPGSLEQWRRWACNRLDQSFLVLACLDFRV